MLSTSFPDDVVGKGSYPDGNGVTEQGYGGGRGGGKISRQRRTGGHAALPYARPTTGRHAAAGPSAAQAASTAQTSGIEGAAAGVNSSSRNSAGGGGWGLGSKIWGLAAGSVQFATGLLGWRGSTPAADADGQQEGGGNEQADLPAAAPQQVLTGANNQGVADRETPGETQSASPTLQGGLPDLEIDRDRGLEADTSARDQEDIDLADRPAVSFWTSGRTSDRQAGPTAIAGRSTEKLKGREHTGLLQGGVSRSKASGSAWTFQADGLPGSGSQEAVRWTGEASAEGYQTPRAKLTTVHPGPAGASPEEVARQFMNSQPRVAVLSSDRSPENLDVQVPYTLSGARNLYGRGISNADVSDQDALEGNVAEAARPLALAYCTPSRAGLSRTPYGRPYSTVRRQPRATDVVRRQSVHLEEGGYYASTGGPLRRARVRTQETADPYSRTPRWPLGATPTSAAARLAQASRGPRVGPGLRETAQGRAVGQAPSAAGGESRGKQKDALGLLATNDWARKIMAGLDSMTPPKIASHASSEQTDLSRLPMSERVRRSMEVLEAPPPVETLPSTSGGPAAAAARSPGQGFPPTTPAHFRAAALAIERAAEQSTPGKGQVTVVSKTLAIETAVEVPAKQPPAIEAGPSTSSQEPATSAARTATTAARTSALPALGGGGTTLSFGAPLGGQNKEQEKSKEQGPPGGKFSFGGPPVFGSSGSSMPAFGGAAGSMFGGVNSGAPKKRSEETSDTAREAPPSGKRRAFRMSANFEDEGNSDGEREAAAVGGLFGAPASTSKGANTAGPATSAGAAQSLSFSGQVKKGESFADLQKAGLEKPSNEGAPSFEFDKDKKDVSFSALASGAASSEPPPTPKLGGFVPPATTTTPSTSLAPPASAPPPLFSFSTTTAPASTPVPSMGGSLFPSTTPPLSGVPAPAKTEWTKSASGAATPAFPGGGFAPPGGLFGSAPAAGGEAGGGLLGFLKSREKSEAEKPADGAPPPSSAPATAPALFGAVPLTTPPATTTPAAPLTTTPVAASASQPSTSAPPAFGTPPSTAPASTAPLSGGLFQFGVAAPRGEARKEEEQPAATKPALFAIGGGGGGVPLAFGGAPAGASGSAAKSESSPPVFGSAAATTTTPAPSLFTFGGKTTPPPAFGSTGGSAGTGSTAPASTPSFVFGGGASAPATAAPVMGGGASGQSAAPATTTPVFGSSAPAFGSSTSTTAPPPAFGSTSTTTPSPPAFGASTASSTPPAFQFGATAPPATPKPAFGATPPSTGAAFVFGQPSAATPAAVPSNPNPNPNPFAFGSAAAAPAASGPAPGMFTFGAPASTPAAATTTPTPFSFGAKPATPAAAGGFGGGGFGTPAAFGSTPPNGAGMMQGSPGGMEDNGMSEEPSGPPQPQGGAPGGFVFGGAPPQQQAPAIFGAPAANASPAATFQFGGAPPPAQPSAPVVFGAGGGSGAFSMGAGDSGNKGRVVRKAKRPAGGRR